MHTSKKGLPVERMDGYEGRTTQLGEEYYVAFESVPAGFGGAELFKGLPNDACQCPHWGYLIKGSFRRSYTDGSEEVVSAGEAYYAPPGHVFEAMEDCELVEFSPKEALEKTMQMLERNIQEVSGGSS